MDELIDRGDVERVLGDPRFLVPEADGTATRPAQVFRARASRFVNGAAHDERRVRIEGLIAGLDPEALAADAAHRVVSGLASAPGRAGVEEVAAHVPVACLAAALGFAEPDAAPPLVAVLADAYPTGAPSDAADLAAARLMAAAPTGADGEAALRVQLLVQAYAATAGLIVDTVRRAGNDPSASTPDLLATVLRDTPPVAATRRISPAGDVVVLRLGGPDRAAPHLPPRVLAFGAGERACPAPHLAIAIAAAIVDRLRAC